MRIFFLSLLIVLLYSCQREVVEKEENIQIQWGHTQNSFSQPPQGTQAYFLIDNPTDNALDGSWEIRFNAFMGEVQAIKEGYKIVHLDGEYYALRPTEDHAGIPAKSRDSIPYISSGTTLKETMAPKGFFLLQSGDLQPLEWSQTPMRAQNTFHHFPVEKVKRYNDPSFLFSQYSNEVAVDHPIVPTPTLLSYLPDSEVVWLTKYQGPLTSQSSQVSNTNHQLATNRIHLWYSGTYWSAPMRVFKGWLEKFYGVELVIHAEEKPEGPHLELIYERTIEENAYEIYNFTDELTVISASDPSGMLAGLATVMQSLKIEGDRLGLPLAEVKDAPRFTYRGQHLDVSRNFQSKESVLRLLDLMALFKLNTFHFHLTDDEGWRLEIPDLPELTSVGATRGYTPDESDKINPAYGSGGQSDDPYGTGFYSQQDFIDILQYADERQIKVIPEIDLPGHARAAIKAMQAYEKRTGDTSYRLHDPADNSTYRSIQGYPDNVINVCQESTYNFLHKIVVEIDAMYDSAQVNMDILHTGGDEVPAGVWRASPSCLDLLTQMEKNSEDGEVVKNILSTHFLSRFQEILNEQSIQVAGWEEIGMKRELVAKNQYNWKVNPELSDQDFITYVWNSLGGNLDLGYRLANAGYDVVLCNVTNFYFDLAYSTDPAEGGLYWGGFVDTYSPWAFAPFDVVKTVPAPWYIEKPPTETELRTNTVKLNAAARNRIVGIQGQLWTETVRGNDQQEHYLWPKMLGLAERAWSQAASWESITDADQRNKVMAEDWKVFSNRLGQFTLPLLDNYETNGVNYRLPPAGGIIEDGKLVLRTAFPGLPIFYQLKGENAIRYNGPVALGNNNSPITIWTQNANGKRQGVAITLN